MSLFKSDPPPGKAGQEIKAEVGSYHDWRSLCNQEAHD